MTTLDDKRLCGKCGRSFKPNPARKDMACAVLHSEGDCCHYSETEVKATLDDRDMEQIKEELAGLLPAFHLGKLDKKTALFCVDIFAGYINKHYVSRAKLDEALPKKKKPPKNPAQNLEQLYKGYGYNYAIDDLRNNLGIGERNG